MEIEIEVRETLDFVKRVRVGLDDIVAALGEAQEQAAADEADGRQICRAINAAYQVFEAVSRVQIMRELTPEHRSLIAVKLREQADRFAKPMKSSR